LFVPALGRVEIPDVVISVLLVGLLVGSVGSLLIRFRRSSGVERQQIKWVALAVAALVGSFFLSTIAGAIGLDESLVDTVLSGIAFIALPVSVAVAVLQYHLYDLDVVVKKALVAGTLVLLVIGAYAAVVGLLGVVTSGQESSGSVFIVALLLGLAFRPVTRFARRVADRIVYGRRATPYEVLAEFSERVGESYATEDVLGRMAQILGQATGAASASVWLRVGAQLRPVASWPSDAEPARVARVTDDALPTLAGEDAVEVRDRGELLGALSVTMPPSDPMNPAKERLVRDLASQAGLVLRNVRLVEELRASQRRLVTAQDQERRRLERNIHDGAQQQLVALSVKTRLARDLTPRDPGKAAEMLTQIDAEIQKTLEDLRDIARGIYPPLLVDKGLGVALDAQARRSLVPTTVQAERIGRYPPELEAAVYFSCLEALQNVTKYADASSATVTLTQSNGHLTFEVADDGSGFDPEAVRSGTGLQGIADRLSALHGELTILSEPGAGTRVRGRIEVGA
jgi:signal transduction histidine kinase